MNDCYAFLVEQVFKLERNSESRRKVYDSAREELVTKLMRPALRVPEAEIAGECRALETAIQKIEADLARKGISGCAKPEDPSIPRISANHPH